MTIESKIQPYEIYSTQESHRKAAEHSDAASSAHREAIKQLKAGNHKEAGVRAAVAHGHSAQAQELSLVAIDVLFKNHWANL